MKPLLSLLAALLVISNPAFADIAIDNVKAFETAEGMKNGAVLLNIKNTGAEDDKLVSASSDVADKTEIHEMAEENGVMKMREVKSVDVKAGETVELKAGGYHIMLMGLKKPLKADEKFPMTLTFEKAGAVTKDVGVVSRKTTAADHSSHEHH